MADNHQIVANLFTALENQVFLGDQLAQGEFTTLLSPGQFVSSNLAETPNTDDMYIQWDLTDSLLDTSFIYTPLGGNISRKYKEMLEFSALPLKSASPDDDAEIADLKTWLGQNNKAYSTYQGFYEDAQDAYTQEVLSPSPNPVSVQRLAAKKLKAFEDWKDFGFKQEYETKQGLLNQLLKGDPAGFWNDITNQFDTSQGQAPRGAYYPTYFIPPSKSWSDPATSWAAFDQTITDSSSTAISRSTSWSGGAGLNFGLWSIGGSASGSSTYNHTDSDTSQVHIHFEYLRVRIQRPWFVPDIFSYHWWTWMKTHGWATISDGGSLQANPPVRPVGQMPFIPTHFILARNVQVSSSFTHNDQTTITSQLSAGVSFGYGPFSISGSYSEGSSTTTVNSHFDGTTLTITQPQIIAYTGFLVAKSPDPLPAGQLPWGNDALLPASLQPSDLAQVLQARGRDIAFLRASVARQQLLSDRQQKKAIEDVRLANQLRGLYEAALLADGQQQQRLAAGLMNQIGVTSGPDSELAAVLNRSASTKLRGR